MVQPRPMPIDTLTPEAVLAEWRSGNLEDLVELGVAAARLLVALESEDLHGRIARHTPGTDSRVDIVLL